jgi:hypothetical protein
MGTSHRDSLSDSPHACCTKITASLHHCSDKHPPAGYYHSMAHMHCHGTHALSVSRSRPHTARQGRAAYTWKVWSTLPGPWTPAGSVQQHTKNMEGGLASDTLPLNSAMVTRCRMHVGVTQPAGPTSAWQETSTCTPLAALELLQVTHSTRSTLQGVCQSPWALHHAPRPACL